MDRKPNCTCTICNAPIYRRPIELERSEGKAYCSKACFGISKQKQRTCPVCNSLFLSQLNRRHCSRACANKSRTGIRYRQGDTGRDRAKESRALKRMLIDERGPKCQRCGYSDVNILVVHHIHRRSDGGTNDRDNVELVCPNCHAEIHFYGTKHSKRGTKPR